MRHPIVIALVSALLLSACQTVSTSGGDSTAGLDPTPPATSPASGTPTPAASPTLNPSPSPRLNPTIPPSPPSPSPAGEAAAVYLSGPFGYLDGMATPAGDPPKPAALRALDQHAQRANLDIGFRDRQLEFLNWVVTVSGVGEDVTDGAAELATGPGPGERADLISLVGPDAGEWLLRLDAEIVDSPPATYHWRLVVPDRDMPADGRLEVMPPDLLVRGQGAPVVSERGSGCYVSGCGDIGMIPPAHLLPRVRAADGVLTLELSDASGLVRWQIAGRPLGDPAAERLFADAEAPDGERGPSFQVPAGDWHLEVRIWFDLERGDYTHYVRAIVP